MHVVVLGVDLVCPLFPQMWINPCAQVIFDSDPAPKDMSGPAGVEMMSQAMIRCVEDLGCVAASHVYIQFCCEP